MTTPRKTPFTVYSADPSGLNVGTSAGNDPITATAVTIFPGSAIEIDAAMYAGSRDRHGDSWMDLTDDEQRARWGKIRFGVADEIPESVMRVATESRRAQLRAERDNLRATNPHVAKATAASHRLAELNAAIGDQS